MSSDGPTTLGGFRGTLVRDDGSGPVLLEHRQRLLVVEGPDRGKEVEIPATRLSIGSASSNDLVLTDGTVSRRHCSISVERERYVLRDLESTNGTSVDGIQVAQAFLEPGARIALGDTVIVFQPRKKWERVDVRGADRFGALCGSSAPMRAVYALLAKTAPTDLSCILVGETGTGKELAARALHDHSSRAAKPFVVVDCGAIQSNLIESELFGHERGAFTGADRQRVGAFETADGGTVFLDEIGELPIELQPKLLRVLERKELKRLGASKMQDVDVRVVAATHRNLASMLRDGEFREDLYYRLAEVVIELPPLRERLADVSLIAQRMLADLAQDGPPPTLEPDALAELCSRPWPGNVRELRNVLTRAVLMASGPAISAADLGPKSSGSRGIEPTSADVAEDLPLKDARDRWVAPLEREYLLRLVRRCGGDLDRAANEAGVHRKSLERLLRQHGLKASDFRG